MLTGDNEKTAAAIAARVGISEVVAGVLPDGKAEVAVKYKKDVVAMVGDGINDAPVLTRADIGIAMGAMGSDAAIEAADVVLMDDEPMQIVKAIQIAKKCISIVKQNIAFALGVKFTCLALSAIGMSNMWFAIFADVGVAVLAILNAMRALKFGK